MPIQSVMMHISAEGPPYRSCPPWTMWRVNTGSSQAEGSPSSAETTCAPEISSTVCCRGEPWSLLETPPRRSRRSFCICIDYSGTPEMRTPGFSVKSSCFTRTSSSVPLSSLIRRLVRVLWMFVPGHSRYHLVYLIVVLFVYSFVCLFVSVTVPTRSYRGEKDRYLLKISLGIPIFTFSLSCLLFCCCCCCCLCLG